jgi:hypothetical protein
MRGHLGIDLFGWILWLVFLFLAIRNRRRSPAGALIIGVAAAGLAFTCAEIVLDLMGRR